jgi:hypothetical protein
MIIHHDPRDGVALAAFKSEWWPASRRNSGRLQDRYPRPASSEYPMWLRYQPGCALSRWFHDRLGGSRGRLRKVMIVALARKLLITWWTMLLKQHRISC